MFILVFVVLLSPAAAEARTVCLEGETLCGNLCHNPTRTMCCGANHTLIDLHGSSTISCCNGSLYDQMERTCCGNQLIRNTPDDEQGERCCGGSTVYDSLSELCCAGVTRPRRIHSHHRGFSSMQCCGNDTYDVATQVCCEFDINPSIHFSIRTKLPGHQYRCCGYHVIDIESEYCRGNGLTSADLTSSVCGPSNTEYNPSHHICCDGNLYALSEFFGQSSECCGTVVYDASRSICCSNSFVINITIGNEACCPRAPLGYINSTTHVCCGGRPQSKRKSSSGGTDVIACCGESTIDARFQSCCYDIGMTTATPYITRRQKCCGGHVIAADLECCANLWPMSASDVCCPHSGPISRRRRGDDACCESRFNLSPETRMTYNRRTAVCSEGRVTPRWSTTTCGGHTFDATTQTCCSGRVFDSKPQAEYICVDGSPVYNHIECSGTLNRRCGSVCYSDVTHVCCSLDDDDILQQEQQQSPILYPLRSANDTCCGVELYDVRRHACVDGRVISTTSGRRRHSQPSSSPSSSTRRHRHNHHSGIDSE